MMDAETILPAFAAEFPSDVRLDSSGSVLITSDGEELILRRPPTAIDPSDALGSHALAAIRAVCQHVAAVREIQNDPRASDFAKTEKRLPTDLTAVRAIAVAHDTILEAKKLTISSQD